ncbi:MAG: hypothetical protein ABIJ81_02405 [Patescibacteria group bacterium]
MSRTLKIFIACTLGAFIGSLVALQFNTYLWWIGLIVGGLVGYITYDFQVVRKAIATAWHKTFALASDVKYWKNFILYAGAWFMIVLWIFGVIFLLTRDDNDPWAFPAIVILTLTITFSILETVFQAHMLEPSTAKKIIYRANPLAVLIFYPIWGIFIAIWFIPKTIFRFFAAMPKWPEYAFVALFFSVAYVVVFVWDACSFVKRVFWNICLFTKQVFVLIHSDERLLCGVDAAIGAGIGYFYSNPLIGALVGGIIGVIDYELVSKLWLKLPQKANAT